MPFNSETVQTIVANDTSTAEDKVKLLLAEHEADSRGLIQKRDELLSQEKKLKEQLKSLETKAAESTSRVAILEEELKKSAPEEHKKFYETQLAEKEKAWQAEIVKVANERDNYRQSHYKRLRDDAINEGIKDLQFIDGLKDGFIARAMSLHTFEPKEIDGQTQWLNRESKTVKDVVHEFALSKEGKLYLQSTGGGASAAGSGGIKKTVPVNPFVRETLNLTEQSRLSKEDPAQFELLKAAATAMVGKK